MSLQLAARNLFRQLRRSVSALLTIGGGVLALLLAQGYSAAMFSEFRDSAIQAEYGHLQLTLPEFHRKGRSNLNAFTMESLPAEILEALPPGSLVSPRFLLTGLASAGEVTLPFSAMGVDAARDTQGGRALALLAGQRLPADGSPGALLGKGLAQKLNVTAGDTVVLLVTTEGDQLNARETVISGIVSASSDAVNDGLMVLPIGFSRELMRSAGAHQQLVFLPEDAELEAVEASLAPLAKTAGLELRNWLSLAEFYRRAEALFAQQLRVMLVIVAVILLLSISNTMMMSVLERTREIGTVMALGTPPRRVLSGFVFEGGLLGVLGVLLGIVLAMLAAAFISALQIDMPPPPGFSVGYRARIEFSLESTVSVALLSWTATVIASCYPAWRASKLEIVDALRVVR